jgi:aryl-alcohol dehydrogenase-like predicted oxidoreductase
LKGLCASAALANLSPALLRAAEQQPIKKTIPGSGEPLSVIGMGTSRTFDAGDDPALRQQLTDVLQAFFDNGGQLIDSSPVYGSAEQVLGDLLKNVRNKDGLFAATKVWIYGEEAGIDQMKASMDRMGVETMDLMQIHNLRDWRTHMNTLREWKRKGRIRYLGITTSHGRAHDEFIDIMKAERPDFVQFSYNIDNREAEQDILPLAAELGIATLVNRPFQRGGLFSKVRDVPLPDWAGDIDCDSWAQIFLKYIVSHPAVTCVIPATSKVEHMLDNMAAGYGRLPDPDLRQRMEEDFARL